MILALRAHVLFEIEKEYVISRDGELYLLDGASGRMMPGVKLRGGQHQALEVKEKILPISARLIANKSSFKFKNALIEKIKTSVLEQTENA